MHEVKVDFIGTIGRCFPDKSTCGSFGMDSMFKDVQNPFLQLRVLLDFSITFIVEAEHSLNKPGENNN